MKNLIVVGCGIALLFASANQVSAFYNPSTGRWLSRDPLGEASFETMRHDSKANLLGDGPDSYAFVRNDPVVRQDYLGLSSQDVRKIFAVFMDVFMEMCAKCNRCNFPNLGNLIALIPRNNMMGCTEQAITMHKRLDDMRFTYDWDAKWTFDTPYKPAFQDGVYPHNWVTATSDDEEDPKIAMDTWKGCLTVTFPTRSGANWKTCFNCPAGPNAKKYTPQRSTP